jgi:hypothetical protein
LLYHLPRFGVGFSGRFVGLTYLKCPNEVDLYVEIIYIDNWLEKTIMSGGGRPQEILDSDIFAVLERLESPFITTGDVADAVGCTRDGARRRLNELEDRGELESRVTGARSKVWYDPDGRSLSVIVFPNQERFVLSEPTDGVLSAARRFASEAASHGGSYWFRTGTNTYSHSPYQSAEQIRSDVSLVLNGYEQYQDRLVARWRGERGLIIRSDDGKIVASAPTEQFCDTVLDILHPRVIKEKSGPTDILLAKKHLLTIRLVLDDEGLEYSDFRDEKTDREQEYEGNVEPARRGDLQDVPDTGLRFFGIDSDWQYHLYDVEYPAKVVYVVSDRKVIHEQRISDGDLSTWVDHVRDTGLDWVWLC